jgi:hypothetical protein
LAGRVPEVDPGYGAFVLIIGMPGRRNAGGDRIPRPE